MSTPSEASDEREQDHPLWSLRERLVRDHVFTDLTHAFFPGMPHFPAFPDEEREQVFEVEPAASRCTGTRSSASGAPMSTRRRTSSTAPAASTTSRWSR